MVTEKARIRGFDLLRDMCRQLCQGVKNGLIGDKNILDAGCLVVNRLGFKSIQSLVERKVVGSICPAATAKSYILRSSSLKFRVVQAFL
jgi:hypothetical protein